MSVSPVAEKAFLVDEAGIRVARKFLSKLEALEINFDEDNPKKYTAEERGQIVNFASMLIKIGTRLPEREGERYPGILIPSADIQGFLDNAFQSVVTEEQLKLFGKFGKAVYTIFRDTAGDIGAFAGYAENLDFHHSNYIRDIQKIIDGGQVDLGVLKSAYGYRVPGTASEEGINKTVIEYLRENGKEEAANEIEATWQEKDLDKAREIRERNEKLILKLREKGRAREANALESEWLPKKKELTAKLEAVSARLLKALPSQSGEGKKLINKMEKYKRKTTLNAEDGSWSLEDVKCVLWPQVAKKDFEDVDYRAFKFQGVFAHARIYELGKSIALGEEKRVVELLDGIIVANNSEGKPLDYKELYAGKLIMETLIELAMGGNQFALAAVIKIIKEDRTYDRGQNLQEFIESHDIYDSNNSQGLFKALYQDLSIQKEELLNYMSKEEYYMLRGAKTFLQMTTHQGVEIDYNQTFFDGRSVVAHMKEQAKLPKNKRIAKKLFKKARKIEDGQVKKEFGKKALKAVPLKADNFDPNLVLPCGISLVEYYLDRNPKQALKIVRDKDFNPNIKLSDGRGVVAHMLEIGKVKRGKTGDNLKERAKAIEEKQYKELINLVGEAVDPNAVLPCGTTYIGYLLERFISIAVKGIKHKEFDVRTKVDGVPILNRVTELWKSAIEFRSELAPSLKEARKHIIDKKAQEDIENIVSKDVDVASKALSDFVMLLDGKETQAMDPNREMDGQSLSQHLVDKIEGAETNGQRERGFTMLLSITSHPKFKPETRIKIDGKQYLLTEYVLAQMECFTQEEDFKIADVETFMELVNKTSKFKDYVSKESEAEENVVLDPKILEKIGRKAEQARKQSLGFFKRMLDGVGGKIFNTSVLEETISKLMKNARRKSRVKGIKQVLTGKSSTVTRPAPVQLPVGGRGVVR